MKCCKCNEDIQEDEKRELYGQILCEDCYLDRLSPAKACDPWAVYAAKSFLKQEKSNANIAELTGIQSKILQILKDTNGLEPEELMTRLQIKPSDFEREFSTLRHMEKARAEMRDGKKILCLW